MAKQVTELSEDDLKQAVVAWFEKKLGARKKISVSIGTHAVMRGMGMSEREEREVLVTVTEEEI